jgi:polyisoprenoid-binding protein YceI
LVTGRSDRRATRRDNGHDHQPHPHHVHAGTWTVDAAATTAAFHAVGLGGAKVRGHDPGRRRTYRGRRLGQPAHVDAVLDATGVDTGKRPARQDLRSKRFLKVDTNPVIRFSAATVRDPAAGWTLEGTLSAAGVQCPITLAVETGPVSDGSSRVRATGEVDLRSLGIKVPSSWSAAGCAWRSTHASATRGGDHALPGRPRAA